MSDVNLEELREKARVEYGVVNADDMNAEQLQSEMDAIDKQAADAEKEAAANAESDSEDSSSSDEGSEESVALSRQNKEQLLATAEAEGVEVEDGDTVPVLREKIAAKRAESEEDEDEDEDVE